MNKISNFDLLIVYSEGIATSSNSLSEDVVVPFSKESGSQNYNGVYGYFLEICRKYNLKAAFTTSADIIGAGKCQSFWLYENKAWIKVQKVGFSKTIFDKFSPTRAKIKKGRDLLFSSKQIKPFNNPDLFALCFDKQKTYERLHKFSIPTVTIKNNTKLGLYKACKELSKQIETHPNKKDFSNEIVMKDRFGAGGLNVYKFESKLESEMTNLAKKHKTVSFIIQPFVKFDKGLSTEKSSSPIDIRLVYLRKKIVQTYLRIAKRGEFRCNEHRGGLLKYIAVSKVPLEVRAFSKNIVKLLNTEDSLFTLDFIISNDGNVYLLEANTGPGLDWNLSLKENEIEAKRLIRIIVKDIRERIRAKIESSKTKTKVNSTNIFYPSGAAVL